MTNYYSVDGILYSLTNKQKKELDKLYPSIHLTDDEHYARLKWIEDNGKLIGHCENLAY